MTPKRGAVPRRSSRNYSVEVAGKVAVSKNAIGEQNSNGSERQKDSKVPPCPATDPCVNVCEPAVAKHNGTCRRQEQPGGMLATGYATKLRGRYPELPDRWTNNVVPWERCDLFPLLNATDSLEGCGNQEGTALPTQSFLE